MSSSFSLSHSSPLRLALARLCRSSSTSKEKLFRKWVSTLLLRRTKSKVSEVVMIVVAVSKWGKTNEHWGKAIFHFCRHDKQNFHNDVNFLSSLSCRREKLSFCTIVGSKQAQSFVSKNGRICLEFNLILLEARSHAHPRGREAIVCGGKFKTARVDVHGLARLQCAGHKPTQFTSSPTTLVSVNLCNC